VNAAEGHGFHGTTDMWRAARTLLALGTRTAPGWMAATFGLATLGTVGLAFFPFALKVMLDAITSHDGALAVLGAVLAALLAVLTWATGLVGANLGFQLADRIGNGISTAVARAVASVSGVEHLEDADYQRDLATVERERNDLATAPRQLLILAQVVFRLLLIAGIFGWVYPPLALLAVAGLVPSTAEMVSSRWRKADDAALAEGRRMTDELFAMLADVAVAQEIKVYGMAPELLARHHALTATDRRRSRGSAVRCALVAGVGWLVFAGAFALGTTVVVIRARHGQASVGDVLLAIALVQRTQVQMTQITQLAGHLSRGAATAAALHRLERHDDRTAAADPVPARLRRGISLTDVRFGYPGADADALNGVSLEIPAGTVVALVGPNGSGKTTLVNLLLGMYELSGGAIQVDGVDLRALDIASWRARTAATFQDFARLEFPLLEAVGIGDLRRIGDRGAAETALARVGVTAPDSAFPDGLDTSLGRSFADGVELSRGQWQKVALARGLMRDEPLFLVLDEPSSAFDPVAEGLFLANRQSTARQVARRTGAITIVITHRLSAVRDVDLVVVLDGGSVVEVGRHRELVAAGGRYAEMFETQARGYR
jgi:ATP-binding cassette, subfamily B, bacterial